MGAALFYLHSSSSAPVFDGFCGSLDLPILWIGQVAASVDLPLVLLANLPDAVLQARSSEDVFCVGRVIHSRKNPKKVYGVSLSSPAYVF